MPVQNSPNVVFVFSDQHRGMDVGCAGNRDVSTPHMDGLAEQGRLFDHAYANVPVCGPSRATLLTGRYPLSHGVVANDLPLPTDATTIADAFRNDGYRTGYVGKWHLDGVPRDGWTPPGPRRQGFEYWAAYNCAHDYFDARYYADEPEPVEIEGYEPIAQTDLALDFIERNRDQPFCLFLSFGPPHAPYADVPTEYTERYDEEEIAMRPNAEPIPPGDSSLNYCDHLVPRETIADYYAQISAIDEQLGRITGRLEEYGLDRDTILVYTSDHGDMLWSQGKMKKEQPWEESIHVPFVIRWPERIPSGTVDDTLLGTVDVAPTLLGLADVDPPGGMEGADHSRRVRGEDAGGPDSVFLMELVAADQAREQDLPEWRGVRTRRYTYARLRDGTGWLLYDNVEDPYQQRNLVLSADYRDVRERLDRELDGWLERTGDDFVEGTEHVRQLGVDEEWTRRERELHPDDPDLV